MSRERRMRVLPPVVLLVLCGIAYVLYWQLQTTGENDPVDSWLALVLGLGSVFVAVYICVRTVEWRPQILGAVAYILGSGTFYLFAASGRFGWRSFPTEVILDVLRAFASVGILVMVGGIAFFEWARARGRVVESEPVIDPNRIYDRRSGKDRRKGYGRLPE